MMMMTIMKQFNLPLAPDHDDAVPDEQEDETE